MLEGDFGPAINAIQQLKHTGNIPPEMCTAAALEELKNIQEFMKRISLQDVADTIHVITRMQKAPVCATY